MLDKNETIPVWIITGFLGSGKTTILNHFVKQPKMASTALIAYSFALPDPHRATSKEELAHARAIVFDPGPYRASAGGIGERGEHASMERGS